MQKTVCYVRVYVRAAVALTGLIWLVLNNTDTII